MMQTKLLGAEFSQSTRHRSLNAYAAFVGSVPDPSSDNSDRGDIRVAASTDATPSGAAIEPEEKLASSWLVRMLLVAAGFVSLALGIVGIVLPLIPTTPFVLLAAACFMRSSPRLHAALLQHPWCGPYIRSWRAGLGIPLRAKILATTMMILGIGSSAIWIVPVVTVKWLLVAIGSCVCLYIWRQPTASRELMRELRSASSRTNTTQSGTRPSPPNSDP